MNKVMLNKPIYVGASILDLSKLHMFQIYYEILRQHYNDHINLLYTDTDSLMYHVRTDDAYGDIATVPAFVNLFDTSGYPQPNRYKIPTRNKKEPGKLKDEKDGDVILEFAGLRAKAYTIKAEGSVTKKAKGVGRQVVREHLTFEDFVDCLKTRSSVLRAEQRIQSVDHVLTTNKVRKIALDPDDDKRYVLECGIHTLPWGHRRLEINKNCAQCK